ncbi:Apolipophorin -like protein [Halotydeus destructor]|nr:Apolipophorin -like protein [Halotydeus destructor]
MELRLALIALAFVGIVHAVPVTWESNVAQCARQCSAPENFNYQTGKTYTYSYESLTKLHLNDEEGPKVRVAAKVDISVIEACELSLKLRDVQVSGPVDKAELKSALEAEALMFAYNDGQIESICPTSGDQRWAVNVKKGILSALQVNLKSLTGKTMVRERDVLGDCDTTYDVLSSNPTSTTIRKTKDMATCARRHKATTAIFPRSYLSPESAIQSLPLLSNDFSCDITIAKNIVQKSICTDKNAFLPLTWSQSGSHIETIISLEFERATSGLAAGRPSGISRQHLLYARNPEANSEDDVSVTAQLREMCPLVTDEIKSRVPAKFAQLVYSIRSLGPNAVQRISDSIKRGDLCGSAKLTDLFNDALIMAGTEGPVKTIVDQIKNKQIAAARANYLLTMLAFANRPTTGAIKAVLPLLEASEVPRQAMLGVSAMIRNLIDDNEEGHDHANAAEIKQIVQALLAIVRRDKNSSNAIVALKSLRNIGHIGSDAVQAILDIATDKRAKTVIRVVAFAALKEVADQEQVNRKALDILADQNENTEVRIAAYKVAVEKASRSSIQEIISVLKRESSKQVGSYVSSHLENIKETASPHSKAVRDLLTDENIPSDRFPKDIRKYSRNFEVSHMFEPLNIGAVIDADIIYDQSFAPRTLKVNVTLPIAGKSLNLFELGIRQVGLEDQLESVFGPHGSLSKKNVPQMFSELVDFFQGESIQTNDIRYKRAAMSGSQSSDLEGQMWLKLDGKTIVFLDINDLHSGMNDMRDVMSAIQNKAAEAVSSIKGDRSFAYMFVDSIHDIPSVNGMPIKMDINGTMVAGYKAGDNGIFPSLAIQMSSKIGFDVAANKPGIKMVQLFSAAPAIQARVESKDGRPIKVTFSLPKDNVELFNFKSDIRVVDVNNAERPMKNSNVRNVEGCTRSFSDALGVELCSKMITPKPFFNPNAPVMPLNGPWELNLVLKKTDPGMQGWEYTLELPPTGASEMKLYRLAFNTPGSRVNREYATELQVSTPRDGSLGARLRVKSPVKTVEATASHKMNADEMNTRIEVTMDNKDKYAFEIGMDKESRGKKAEWKPKLNIQVPGAKPIILGGSVVLDQGRRSQLAFDLHSNQEAKQFFKGQLIKEGAISRDFKLSSDIQGDLGVVVFRIFGMGERQAKSMSSDVKIEYQRPNQRKHNIKMVGKVQNLSAGSLAKVNSFVEVQMTQFPQNNFHFSWNVQHKPSEHLENEITFNWRDQMRDPKRRIHILQVSTATGLMSGRTSTTENLLTVEIAPLNINYQLKGTGYVEKSDSPKFKVEFEAQDKIRQRQLIKSAIEYQNLSKKPLKISIDASLKLPSREMLYADKVEEVAPNEYKGKTEVQWQTGKKATLDYTYRVKTDSKKTHHEIDARLKTPSNEYGTHHQGLLRLSPDDIEIKSKLNHEQNNLWDFQSVLSNQGKSNLYLDTAHFTSKVETNPYDRTRTGAFEMTGKSFPMSHQSNFQLAPDSMTIASKTIYKAKPVFSFNANRIGQQSTKLNLETQLFDARMEAASLRSAKTAAFEVRTKMVPGNHRTTVAFDSDKMTIKSKTQYKNKPVADIDGVLSLRGKSTLSFETPKVATTSELDLYAPTKYGNLNIVSKAGMSHKTDFSSDRHVMKISSSTKMNRVPIYAFDHQLGEKSFARLVTERFNTEAEYDRPSATARFQAAGADHELNIEAQPFAAIKTGKIIAKRTSGSPIYHEMSASWSPKRELVLNSKTQHKSQTVALIDANINGRRSHVAFEVPTHTGRFEVSPYEAKKSAKVEVKVLNSNYHHVTSGTVDKKTIVIQSKTEKSGIPIAKLDATLAQNGRSSFRLLSDAADADGHIESTMRAMNFEIRGKKLPIMHKTSMNLLDNSINFKTSTVRDSAEQFGLESLIGQGKAKVIASNAWFNGRYEGDYNQIEGQFKRNHRNAPKLMAILVKPTGVQPFRAEFKWDADRDQEKMVAFTGSFVPATRSNRKSRAQATMAYGTRTEFSLDTTMDQTFWSGTHDVEVKYRMPKVQPGTIRYHHEGADDQVKCYLKYYEDGVQKLSITNAGKFVLSSKAMDISGSVDIAADRDIKNIKDFHASFKHHGEKRSGRVQTNTELNGKIGQQKPVSVKLTTDIDLSRNSKAVLGFIAQTPAGQYQANFNSDYNGNKLNVASNLKTPIIDASGSAVADWSRDTNKLTITTKLNGKSTKTNVQMNKLNSIDADITTDYRQLRQASAHWMASPKSIDMTADVNGDRKVAIKGNWDIKGLTNFHSEIETNSAWTPKYNALVKNHWSSSDAYAEWNLKQDSQEVLSAKITGKKSGSNMNGSVNAKVAGDVIVDATVNRNVRSTGQDLTIDSKSPIVEPFKLILSMVNDGKESKPSIEFCRTQSNECYHLSGAYRKQESRWGNKFDRALEVNARGPANTGSFQGIISHAQEKSGNVFTSKSEIRGQFSDQKPLDIKITSLIDLSRNSKAQIKVAAQTPLYDFANQDASIEFHVNGQEIALNLAAHARNLDAESNNKLTYSAGYGLESNTKWNGKTTKAAYHYNKKSDKIVATADLTSDYRAIPKIAARLNTDKKSIVLNVDVDNKNQLMVNSKWNVASLNDFSGNMDARSAWTPRFVSAIKNLVSANQADMEFNLRRDSDDLLNTKLNGQLSRSAFAGEVSVNFLGEEVFESKVNRDSEQLDASVRGVSFEEAKVTLKKHPVPTIELCLKNGRQCYTLSGEAKVDSYQMSKVSGEWKASFSGHRMSDVQVQIKHSHAANRRDFNLNNEVAIKVDGKTTATKVNAVLDASRDLKAKIKMSAQTPYRNYKNQELNFDSTIASDKISVAVQGKNDNNNMVGNVAANWAADHLNLDSTYKFNQKSTKATLKAQASSGKVSVSGDIKSDFRMVPTISTRLTADMSSVNFNTDVNGKRQVALNGKWNIKSINQFDAAGDVVTAWTPKMSGSIKADRSSSAANYEVSAHEGSNEVFSGKLVGRSTRSGISGQAIVKVLGDELLNSRLDQNDQMVTITADGKNFEAIKATAKYAKGANEMKPTLEICQTRRNKCLKVDASYKNDESRRSKQFDRTVEINIRGPNNELATVDWTLKTKDGLVNKMLVTVYGKKYGYDLESIMSGNKKDLKAALHLPERTMAVNAIAQGSATEFKIIAELLADALNEPKNKLSLGASYKLARNKLMSEVTATHPAWSRPLTASLSFDNSAKAQAKLTMDVTSDPSKKVTVIAIADSSNKNQTIYLTISRADNAINGHLKAHLYLDSDMLTNGAQYSWNTRRHQVKEGMYFVKIAFEPKTIQFVTNSPLGSVSANGNYKLNAAAKTFSAILDTTVNGDQRKLEANITGSDKEPCAEWAMKSKTLAPLMKWRGCVATEADKKMRLISQLFKNGQKKDESSIAFDTNGGRFLRTHLKWDPQAVSNFLLKVSQLTTNVAHARDSPFYLAANEIASEWTHKYNLMSHDLRTEVVEPFVQAIERDVKMLYRQVRPLVKYIPDMKSTLDFVKQIPKLVKSWRPNFVAIGNKLDQSVRIVTKSIKRHFDSNSILYKIAMAYETKGLKEVAYVVEASLENQVLELASGVELMIQKVANMMPSHLSAKVSTIASKGLSFMLHNKMTDGLTQMVQDSSAVTARVMGNSADDIMARIDSLGGLILRNEDVRDLVKLIKLIIEEIQAELNRVETPAVQKLSHDLVAFTLSPSAWATHARFVNFEPQEGDILFELRSPVDVRPLRSIWKRKQTPKAKVVKAYESFKDQLTFVRSQLSRHDWTAPFKAQAHLVGGQHYVTFDRKFYDFAGTDCSYLLAKDTKDNNFTVSVKYSGVDGEGKVMKVITVQIGDQQIELNSGLQVVKVNGQESELPISLPGASVVRQGDSILVDDAKGLSVECQLSRDVCTVSVSGWYFGKTKGMMGSYDYEPDNDFQTPAGLAHDACSTGPRLDEPIVVQVAKHCP